MLVIAANEGVQEQSKRHAYLLSLLGVRQFCVVVNKMDLADYSEARFLEIEKKYRVFLKTLNLETDVFIPASARFGENITARSTKMKWHHGPTLAEALDAMTPMAPPTDLPLRSLRAGCLQVRRSQNYRRPHRNGNASSWRRISFFTR